MTKRDIINRFTNVLYDLTRPGLAEKGRTWPRRSVEDRPSRPGVVVVITEFRSLEKALADLLAEYQRCPNPKLAGTIEMIRAEIQLRKTAQARPSGT